MNQIDMVVKETPEEVAENTRIMNEVVRNDSFTIPKYLEIIKEMNDRWLSVLRRLEEYESGEWDFENTFPVVQRQLSILALEMDRTSVRTVLKEV